MVKSCVDILELNKTGLLIRRSELGIRSVKVSTSNSTEHRLVSDK